MAIKFVDDADLTTVGEAIRAKTGGSDLLTFPAGMAEAVSGIQTAKPEQAKSATPSLSAQTITPDSGKVLSSVSVSAITKELLAQLDGDFVASNILQGVDLFGLAGTATGGGGEVATINGRNVTSGTFTLAENATSYTIPDYHPNSYNRRGAYNIAYWLESNLTYDDRPFVTHAVSGKDYSSIAYNMEACVYIRSDGGMTASSSYGAIVTTNLSASSNTVRLTAPADAPFKAGAVYSWIILEPPK